MARTASRCSPSRSRSSRCVAFVPASRVIAVPLVLLGLFLVLSRPVWSGPNGVLRSGEGALFQGIRGIERDWLDTRAEGEIAVLWTGRADRFTVNMNEFFNARVGQVYYTSAPTAGGFGELPISIDAKASSARPTGRPSSTPYALLDGSVTPDGEALARDDLGMTLWRLDGPLASLTRVGGLYPGDTWSGSWASWRRLRCTGGRAAGAHALGPDALRRPADARAGDASAGDPSPGSRCRRTGR